MPPLTVTELQGSLIGGGATTGYDTITLSVNGAALIVFRAGDSAVPYSGYSAAKPGTFSGFEMAYSADWACSDRITLVSRSRPRTLARSLPFQTPLL